MKLERFLKNNEQGFTLVEMMVTVAIVGILAAAGIPQYRKTIAKAKKGEAQALLGAIATAESSFFSEYGSYGNNLARMGAESDSNNPKLLYRAGFPSSAACGNAAQSAATAANGIPIAVAAPTNISITDPGAAGLLQFPRAFTGYNEILQVNYAQEGAAGAINRANVNTSSMIGRSTFTGCGSPGFAGAQPLTTVLSNAATAPMQAYLGSEVVGGVIQHRFRAIASGYIGPTDTVAARNTGMGPANRNRDIWTIDEQRQMVNVMDGSGAN